MRPSIACRPLSVEPSPALASPPAGPIPAPRRGLATGVFSVGQCAARFSRDLSDRARVLTEPSIAATVLLPTSVSSACSAVAGAEELNLMLTPPLLAWLSPVKNVSMVEVPPELRRHLMCFRALVLPVATPVLHLGWLALPAPEYRRHVVRELEAMVSDFALRLELWQREEVLRFLGFGESAEVEFIPCSGGST